jgi:enoyl reductase-like protein
MTYAEVLVRMVQLMYVTEPYGEWPDEDTQKNRFQRPRWIDVTYESRTFKVASRVEARFRRGKAAPVLANVKMLDVDPKAAIAKLLAAYPATSTTLLADEDIAFFINLCADLRNGKPVNFVPEIDGDFPHSPVRRGSLVHLVFFFER